MINYYYYLITKRGYEIEIKNVRFGFCKMLLVKNNRLIEDVYFRSNRKNKTFIQDRLFIAAANSHTDLALKELYKYILKGE